MILLAIIVNALMLFGACTQIQTNPPIMTPLGTIEYSEHFGNCRSVVTVDDYKILIDGKYLPKAGATVYLIEYTVEGTAKEIDVLYLPDFMGHYLIRHMDPRSE